MTARPIAFLSDYGLADEFVGVVHGVIARRCPEARVIDVSHGIPRQDVRAGALVLARALPFMPEGSVGLAVVDPEVGARRRAVALRCAEEDRLLVGPDNGLLLPAAERFGGVVEAAEISTSPWRLEPVSATFHGRDLFAPVAARLAGGAELADAGRPLDPDELVALPFTRAALDGDALVAHAVLADGYGNVQLDATVADLAGLGVKLGGVVEVSARRPAAPRRTTLTAADAVAEGAPARQVRFARTFADVGPGEVLLYEDPSRVLALAVNGGDAAAAFGVRPGDEVRLRRAP
ncbi:MAG TPA: SAM-dependent chlorinase/fluorinase [Solirubrobacteraceae bacterium]